VLPFSKSAKPLVAVEVERPATSMFSRNLFSYELSYPQSRVKRVKAGGLTAASCVLAAPGCAWAAGTSERAGIA
jgi:hypothetical protein